MDAPKVFISYSWSSPEHEKHVLDLAKGLVESGVDVIIDKWNLREGNDANKFMEMMVTDEYIKKVIMVCDKEYVEKTDSRKGGVGTEAQIISNEIYNKTDQSKFVAVVVENDDNNRPYLPVYYKSRIYIDLSNESDYSKNYEQLLRWIYDKPLYVKPELGKTPEFLIDEKVISLKTSVVKTRLFDSIRGNNSSKYGNLTEYFQIFSKNLESFRIPVSSEIDNYDEKVIESINLFIPYRNEFIELINLLSTFGFDDRIISEIHSFFESLIPYLYKPESVNSWHDWDFDNFRFIINEIFILYITILLKFQHFSVVSEVLNKRYYYAINQDYGRNSMLHYECFYNHLKALKYRNDKLKLNRISLHADLLKERSASTGIDFQHVMQADFVLYIRSIFDSLEDSEVHWYPITLVYCTRWPKPFEIFARSSSTVYFQRSMVIFNIKRKEDFDRIFELFKTDIRLIPKYDYEAINIKTLMNYDNLCKYK